MTLIQRHNLQYAYLWTAIPPDDPRVTGRPDSTFLNRNEGYEVLAFLNRHCTDIAAALKAERMIRNALPGNLRSHANVYQWLKNNWPFFK